MITKARSMTCSIILVNWNGWIDTIACLDSILKLNNLPDCSVFITDNSSKDGSVAHITHHLESSLFEKHTVVSPSELSCDIAEVSKFTSSNHPNLDIYLISAVDNFGFAKGNNLACRLSFAVCPPEFFWILNNDTIVDHSALEHLIDRMRADYNIGICGSTLLFHSHQDVVQAYGGVQYSLLSGRGHHLGGGQRFSPDTDVLAIEDKLSYISGASMLVRSEVFSEVGLMSEDYFLYCEEIDLALRAKGRWRLGFAIKSLVYHKEGASIGTESLNRAPSVLSDFYQARNKLVVCRKFSPTTYITTWFFTLARVISRIRGLHLRNAFVILAVLLGRNTPNPKWFVK